MLEKTITIRNPKLLRIFWGKRKDYPSYVTASVRLWIYWLFHGK